MNESVIQVQNERVDDIPLLVHMLQEMGVAEIIDELTPRHGNRVGLSLGETATVWLAYILSESDHRMSFVEIWAEGRINVLQGAMSKVVRVKDLSDDRLADVLKVLSDDARWEAMENAFNQRHLRVYELPSDTVRIDATSVSMYHESEGSVLIAHGHSKDHRPDLAQVKVLFASMDPQAYPLVTEIVPGNWADDPLYIPAIQRVRSMISKRGLLYVGDSKMEALATRGYVVQGGDYYLHPLSRKGEQGVLLERLAFQALAAPSSLEIIEEADEAECEEEKWLVRGREHWRQQEVIVNGHPEVWLERLLLIQTRTLMEQQKRGLEKRLRHATAKLMSLTPPPGRGRKQFRELAPLKAEVEAILSKHGVGEFLQVSYHQEVTERHVRKYKDRPARTETMVRYWIEVTRREEAIQEAGRLMGWRLLATNAPASRLSLAEAVRVQRGGVPTIERLISRLKGRPLGLRPFFVRREDHIKGLVRLLAIALRTLTLMEFIVRRSLQDSGESLAGLFPGNPTRTTQRPTTERMLQAFKGIDLTIIALPHQTIQHITPLSPLQNRILQLLKFSDSIYAALAHQEPIPI